MMRKLLQSVASAVALSFLLAAYLLASETLHLTRRNPFFVADLGGPTLVGLISWYAVFALVVGVAIGVAARGRRLEPFALAFIGFLLVSLKIFWVDAGMLTSPPIAVVFAAFTVTWFVGAAYVSRRLSLPNTFPVVLTLVYAHVCQAMASRWSFDGGRLLSFLLSRTTLMIALAGCIGVIAVIALQRQLEQRSAWWWRAIVPLGLLLAQLIWIGASVERFPPARTDAPVLAPADSPDIYILSFDAMRTDALETFIESHPASQLASISRQATTFENVVSHGPATNVILANNTFAGSDRTGCGGSLPAQLARRGYVSVMTFARLGRRFEGSECYQNYYAVGAASLMSRYSLPALFGALAHRNHLLQRKGRAEELIDKLRQFADVKAPLFSYLHFLELHAPYVPKHRVRDAAFSEAMNDFMQGCYRVACDQRDPTNARLIELARRSYTEIFDEVDQAVGEVLAIAKQRGRDFVLVITADHGELLGEHGGFAHSGGFVGELLDVPFIVFDSRVRRPNRRCELILSSEAMKATVLGAGMTDPVTYPDRDVLELEMPPLGRGRIDKRTATVQYELADDVIPHAGTWRNVHNGARGTLPYPIERCE